MTLYRGIIEQTAPDNDVELVIASGLCCAVPFQVIEVVALWADFVKFPNLGVDTISASLTVQAVSGPLNIGEKGVLAKTRILSGAGESVVVCQAVLPYQTTKGDLILRLSTTLGTTIPETVGYVIDVKFLVLKELDYMRLKAEGY